MRIGVFSDLHLAPGSTSRCTASREDLLDLCERLEDGCDRVIVAGDLFDLDRPRIPGDWRGQLRAIRREYGVLVERLERFDWVYGNHDYQLQLERVPEERELITADLGVMVLHGHQWDMLLKKVPGVPQTANFIAGWLQRADLQRTARFFQRAPWAIEQAVGRVRSGDDFVDRGIRGARGLIASGWDLVVAGHSHLLRLVPTVGGLYVNSGSLCENTLDYVIIDLGEGRVEAWRDGVIHEVAERRADGWSVESSGFDA